MSSASRTPTARVKRATFTAVMPVAAVLASVASAGGQSVLKLGTADATFAEPFSLVRGARELAGGQLLVTDWIEQRLVLIDFLTGSATERGHVGAGPEEFRLPGQLLPFRGDSTLLVDIGNARLAVLDGAGHIRRVLQSRTPSANAPSAADNTGRVYFAIPPWHATRPLTGDTVELASLDIGADTPTTLARLHGSTPAPEQTAPPDGPRVPIVVFARQDAWTASPAGRLAIVRGADYSIEMRVGQQIVRVPSNAYPPVRAGSEEREAFVRQFLQSSPMSGREANGGLGHTPAALLSDASVAAVIRRSSFADELPYFRTGDARFDPHERLWVGRSTPAGAPLRYDVFDGSGTRIGQVELPADRTLAAFGKAHLYLVATDDVDLQRIERYPYPALLHVESDVTRTSMR